MNVLSNKVKTNPTICGIEFCFGGSLVPSTIEGWQPFYNSMMSDAEFFEAYSGKSYLQFAEVSNTTTSGTSYTQTIQLRFPATDTKRAERLELIRKVKFVKLKLSNGLDLVVGRNDFFQNTSPKVTIKSTIQAAEAEIECISIMPSGYVPNADAFGLPVFIPLSFNYDA